MRGVARGKSDGRKSVLCGVLPDFPASIQFPFSRVLPLFFSTKYVPTRPVASTVFPNATAARHLEWALLRPTAARRQAAGHEAQADDVLLEGRGPTRAQ